MAVRSSMRQVCALDRIIDQYALTTASTAYYILPTNFVQLGAHPWPLKYCMARWSMGRAFLHHCKLGVLQYVAIKNLLSVVMVLLEWRGWYHEGDFSWRYGYVYCTAIANFSQTWALYALVKVRRGCSGTDGVGDC